MKRTIIFGACLCLALVFFAGYHNEYKHVVDSAKLPYFSSGEDVKNDSELIVEVSKISEEPVSYDIGDGHHDNLTLSNVKIEKIIKQMEGKALDKGDVIKIVESEWTDETNHVIHHTENYSKMNTDNKYTLYLGYNSDADNYYPIGLLYGKVPVDTSEKNFYGEIKSDHIKRVMKELQKNPD